MWTPLIAQIPLVQLVIERSLRQRNSVTGEYVACSNSRTWSRVGVWTFCFGMWGRLAACGGLAIRLFGRRLQGGDETVLRREAD